MLKIGTLELDGSPRVAGEFSDKFTVTDIQDAKTAGLDIAEIRVDQFRSFDPDYVNGKLALFGNEIPTLATIRIAREGGLGRAPSQIAKNYSDPLSATWM